MRVLMLLVLVVTVGKASAQTPYADSLTQIVKTTSSDSLRFVTYLDLTSHNFNANQDLAVLYYDSASQIEHVANSDFGKAHLAYIKGQLVLRQESLDAALPHFRRAAELFSAVGDRKMYARSTYTLGTTLLRVSNFDSASMYLVEAEKAHREIGDSIGASNTLSARGIVHRRMGRLDQALSLYEEAAKMTPADHYDGRVNNLINRAIILKNREEFDEAIDMYRQAESLAKDHLSPESDALAYIYGNLSSAYFQMKDYKNALSFGEEALALRRKVATNDQLANALLGVALNSIETKEYAKTKSYLDEALTKAEGNHYILKDIYLAYGKVSQRSGDLKKALDYLELAQEHKDSVYKIQVAQQVDELETKYEVEQKEKDLALASTEKALAEAKLNGSRKFNMALIVCILLLGAFIFWLNRLNKKIKKGAEEKETLLKEIHHRVKNNLQVISALLTLQARHIKDDRARVALKEGQDRVESMALIHRNLYQFDNLKGVNTQEYLDKLLENLLSSYQTDTMQIELNTDIDSIWLDVDTMIPLGLTINELVSNALKHAFKNKSKGQISIALKDLGDNLHLTIKDDGDGVQDLENFTDSSFGYSLINSFARKLSADLTFKNEDGFTLEMLIHSFQRAEKAA